MLITVYSTRRQSKWPFVSNPLPLSAAIRKPPIFRASAPVRKPLTPLSVRSLSSCVFPTGYVPKFREHISTDAIREQAYELAGRLPSTSSHGMALIWDEEPKTTTAQQHESPKLLGPGKGFIILYINGLINKDSKTQPPAPPKVTTPMELLAELKQVIKSHPSE